MKRPAALILVGGFLLSLGIGRSIPSSPAGDQKSAAAPDNGGIVISAGKVGLSPSYGGIIPLKDGRLMWIWGTGSGRKPLKPFYRNISTDGGRTWSDPVAVKTRTGSTLTGVFNANL